VLTLTTARHTPDAGTARNRRPLADYAGHDIITNEGPSMKANRKGKRARLISGSLPGADALPQPVGSPQPLSKSNKRHIRRRLSKAGIDPAWARLIMKAHQPNER
jgi:hypothetical protein